MLASYLVDLFVPLFRASGVSLDIEPRFGRVESGGVYECLDRLASSGTQLPPSLWLLKTQSANPDLEVQTLNVLCETVGESFEMAVRTQGILQDDFEWSVEREGSHAYLRVRPREEMHPGSEELVPLYLAHAVLSLQGATHSSPEVLLSLGSKRRHAAYEGFFGNVSYGGEERFLRVHRDVFETRMHADAGPLKSKLLAQMDRRLGSLGGAPTASVRLTRLYESSPQLLSVNVDALGRRLAVSTRTLQRLLGNEGTSIAEVRDLVCARLALRDLMQRPVGQVAAALGFSEERSFRRAFERWTGHSPSRMRTLLSRSRAFTW